MQQHSELGRSVCAFVNCVVSVLSSHFFSYMLGGGTGGGSRHSRGSRAQPCPEAGGRTGIPAGKCTSVCAYLSQLFSQNQAHSPPLLGMRTYLVGFRDVDLATSSSSMHLVHLPCMRVVHIGIRWHNRHLRWHVAWYTVPQCYCT